MIWGLLAGLFVVPLVLLWMGHRLRRRAPRWRSAFWGAVAGHSAGVLATLWVLHYPAVLWGDGAREMAVHWSMVLGALLGGVIGAGIARADRTKQQRGSPHRTA